VVGNDLGVGIERSCYVSIVSLSRLALNCEHWNTPIRDERRSDVVLSGKGIGGNQDRFGATRLQRAREIGRFSCDVRTGNELHTIQWFLFGEAFPDKPQNRHSAFLRFK